ncbi:Polyribonucleotide nucleotidyltransferase [Fundidesulfovibrio magnetotacticus]|uniref:Polyribonucleotide nucleotidyltransferase n=1 Tax=Fundidesulfovibrio magnetotacticus TaxID=2730080 RepID=A0A6V8LLZ0_9BACT|nr:polyribonucleotide nucleotidyltransferase [Fundidesulfovibrio magnetotacticus]GFK92724.1 Polyribonucleotide nucleotidyltransferase [Fundidesulfovibrio magnetotacticus]
MGLLDKAIRLERTVGSNAIMMETGRMANQADGSVWVQCGGTVVLVTVCSQSLEFDKGFFPLTVEYQEKLYAAGRIPGSYFRREVGRPSEREVTVARLIDRPHRPLFPKGFRDEVQIIATVLSADGINDPDVLAVNGASAALHISSVPFMGPIAAGRVGRIDGQFVLNPPYQISADQTDLNIFIAASRDAVVMVEGGGNFVSEELIAEALEWGHQQIIPLIDMQEELREKAGKAKMAFTPPVENEALKAVVAQAAQGGLEAALSIIDKMERRAARKALRTQVVEAVKAAFPEEPALAGKAAEMLEGMEKKFMRQRIKDTGVRIDTRDTKTVRPIEIEVSMLPRTHGSCLFARGETKALCVATLGSTGDEQRIETLAGESSKRFMLHYNFPPYCVGEVKPLRGPSRREIGHGLLAERSIAPVLPAPGEFPFTLRIISEVMESNGSSSMATVCGGSLALMDAGVPIKAPVAGVAMGLIKEDDQFIVLTDILGDEDAMGDMDFKVAGTAEGVTGIQMDIKITGIPQNVMRQALEQARESRLHILGKMNETLAAPRTELSPYAPQLTVVEINPEKIREVIGPGGKVIKAITASTGASIDIDDSGKISIFAPTQEAMERAKEMVLFYDQKADVGRNYQGKVKKIIDCGAVVEILPGLEGLVHVSQLDIGRVENVTDAVAMGQDLEVKVIAVEPNGRVRLSRKAVLLEEQGETIDLNDFAAPSRPRGDRDSRGGDRRGGDRGGRDRGRR